MDTDSLTIKEVRDGDEGTYTCIMNTTLDQDSASAVLTVVGTSTARLLCEDKTQRMCVLDTWGN